MIPRDARVTPLHDKLSDLDTHDVCESWFHDATWVLRGGDGGGHGLLLYKLIRKIGAERPPNVLEIGTARGFSAITMARAMLDANLPGRVYTIDVIDHSEPVRWHSDTEGKQHPDEPLANEFISRSEIWSRWFAEEATRITPMHGRSHEVLDDWSFGPIDVAFIDGKHTYDAVIRDLSLLEHLIAPGGVIVLDDFHVGVSMGAFRSRPVNGAVRIIGSAARRVWPSAYQRLRLGTGNEFMVVKRRFAGVYRAVSEFRERRSSEWAMEIVSMPARGDYHEVDYSLALLTKR